MKEYRVFERGGAYRVAVPGRFLWHWVKTYADHHKEIFVTQNVEDARQLAAIKNKTQRQLFNWQRDQWKLVHK